MPGRTYVPMDLFLHQRAKEDLGKSVKEVAVFRKLILKLRYERLRDSGHVVRILSCSWLATQDWTECMVAFQFTELILRHLRFKQSSLHCFLQGLRNYFAHYSNPPIAYVMRCGIPNAPGAGIELPKKSLLEWRKWDKLSRDYILQHDQGILLDEIVSKYTTNVGDFLQWFDDHIETVCKQELDDLWQKHEEWASFCKSQGIPTTEAEFKRAAKNGTL